jgi:ketohexokinase
MPKSTTHIVCVGAVYIDTILTVPHFPIEDDKLRAKKLTKRRGGNTANSLEVLTQLVSNSLPSLLTTRLHLISVLPDKQCDATKFIAESLSDVELDQSCVFRAGHSEAASSYILQNELNLSRTIVSVNELDEMTVGEFESKVDGLPVWENGRDRAQVLIHFEGRIPDVTLECVKHLRSRDERGELRISVECEKPERKVMAEVAKSADVVFYSRIWAEVCLSPFRLG